MYKFRAWFDLPMVVVGFGLVVVGADQQQPLYAVIGAIPVLSGFIKFALWAQKRLS